MTIVSSVLLSVSIFLPIASCFSLVQGDRRDDQQTWGQSGERLTGRIGGRNHYTDGLGEWCNHSQEELVDRQEGDGAKVVLMSCTQPSRSNFLQDLLICLWLCPLWGFPVAQMVKNPPAMQETQVRSPGRQGRREWKPTPLFLPGESHGQRSLMRYSPWGHKESDTTELLTLLTTTVSSVRTSTWLLS